MIKYHTNSYTILNYDPVSILQVMREVPAVTYFKVLTCNIFRWTEKNHKMGTYNSWYPIQDTN
jgi:hypothetical protein